SDVCSSDLRELCQARAVRICDKDVVRMQRPDVAAAVVRWRWALGADVMRRAVDDAVTRREEVAARRAAFAGRHTANIRPVDVHGEDLVACCDTFARHLEDQTLAVRGEVCFGILSPVRQLTKVPETRLVR